MRAHSQNLFVAIGPTAQYESVVMIIVGRCIHSHRNKSHTVRIEVRASEARHQNTHRARETHAKTMLSLLEKSVTRRVGASGREKTFTLQGRSHIYYDDVSNGPRPRAHWYMLTHQCCNDTVPSRTRIALHRVPITSPTATTPKYYQIPSTTTKYQVLSLNTIMY